MSYHEEILAKMQWAARRFSSNKQTSNYYKAQRYIRGLIHLGTPTRAGNHSMMLLIKEAEKLPAYSRSNTKQKNGVK